MDCVLLSEWKQNKGREKLTKPKVERGFLKEKWGNIEKQIVSIWNESWDIDDQNRPI